MPAKVRLFTKKEIQRRLNEAQTLANVNAEIQQIQMQIENAKRDYQKRVEPLEKKLIELQTQQSNLSGQQTQQPATQATSSQQQAAQPQGGIQAAPGATSV